MIGGFERDSASSSDVRRVYIFRREYIASRILHRRFIFLLRSIAMHRQNVTTTSTWYYVLGPTDISVLQ